MSIQLHSSRTGGTPHPWVVAILSAAFCAGLLLAPMAHADEGAAAANLAPLPSLAPIVKKVMPAVVNISVLEKAEVGDQGPASAPDSSGPNSPFDEFLRRFFEQQGIAPETPQTPQPNAQRMALGSGFIIDPSGLVVTNNHVVQNAQKVTIVFQDGSKHVAKIVGRDSKTDLALLKIDADQPLPSVRWADSSAAQVGDWVVAVGNPFGLGGTVSGGIISARGRDIHSGPYDDFLQIDAPINRGNSGGPTFNLAGEVIGINTAIYSPSGGSVGIGFAIPSSLAKPVIEQLKEKGKVSRGWLGVQIQEMTPAIARSLGLPNEKGALVADVVKGGPAAKSGLKPGDVILSFNGHDIDKVRDLPIVVAQTPAGSSTKLAIWRKGGTIAVDVILTEQPENIEVGTNSPAPAPSTAMGVKLAALTPALRRQFHIPAEVEGVLVRSIADASLLADADLRAGDVIVSINQEPVTTPEAAVTMINDAVSGPTKSVMLQINRHGTNEYVAWSGSNGSG